MNEIIKNIKQATVFHLKDQILYENEKVVSKTLAQNQGLSITLFAFTKGKVISTHESQGDAFVTCIDGVGIITIDGIEYVLQQGESIIMPARHPHAVYAKEDFKMLLVVAFS